MIPESFKDIVSSNENAGFYQSLALIIFMIFFIGLIIYVFSRPKKHYQQDQNAPLEDDEQTFNG